MGVRSKFEFCLALLACLSAPPLHAAEPLKIVATQALFADLVKEVGKDAVEVSFVASPKFNVHFIQPKPSDVRRVSKADLYVNSGLDLEAWSDPLLEAAGKPSLFRGADRNLDLSRGIPLRNVPEGSLSRSEGDQHLFGNPHFHMDPENARTMVKTIADKLKGIDPANAAAYEANAADFLARLDARLEEWKRECAHCAGQEILSYHDDVEYLAHFLGLTAHRFLEPKPGIPPTARHLASLVADVKEHGVRAIVQPTYYSRNTADYVAGKTGAKVVLIAQNAGELPGTETFFGLFDANVKAISEALK
jgi:zinc/manganese transport system substrate-binding protein